MPLPQLILLNGTSSSGKTSIAQCLQEQLDVVYLNFSIDSILYTLPPSDLSVMIEGGTITRGAYDYARLVHGFHAAIAGLLATGNRLIVDNAMIRQEWRADFAAVAAPYTVVRIGVFCDLAVTEERERARGNRARGTAKSEFPHVHTDMNYDFTVDTSACTPDDAVTMILGWLSTTSERSRTSATD